MIEKIEIPISKKKIIFLLGGGVILIAGGSWLAADPENFIPNLFRITDPDFLRFWGIAGLVFLGLALIFGITKLFDKRSGLIIDQDGITDNSNASSIGLIKWTDITGIRTEQVMSTKFFLIDVKNPEDYIENSNSSIQKKLLRANMNKYGTPLSVISSTLDYDFDRLERLIRDSRAKTCGNNI